MQIEFQAGATVRARGARFIVLSADTIAQSGNDSIRRLRLRALEEPFRNEEICVLHPIENVEPDQIPELDLLRPGRIARFLLMDAIRLSLAPGDDRLVSSSRSKIDFEPYQQVPALRALELPRPRLLIADDVGLGKTIEAGLILRELNARRRAARILIVSPASITEQWQTELATKFGFDFRILDSEGVAEARRSLEAGTNPWCVEPRVIASVDFIKRREGAFRELSASRWDVIIIDEAHHPCRIAAWPMACARWLLPVPPGPRNSASSRRSINTPVARSKTILRFIFGLKLKSKLSSVLLGSRKAASLRRRSKSRSERRVNSSETSVASRSIGAMGSACACCRRVSSTAAIPPRRSWRRLRCSSLRFILGSPGSCYQ